MKWLTAFIPSPVYGWALLGVFLLGGGLAGTAAWKYKTYQCQADKLASVERAIRQAEEIAAQDQVVLQAHVKREVRTRTVFRNLYREVVRYVETHPDPVQCLDDDGLRIWRNANADPQSAAGADAAVRGAAPAEKRPAE